MKVSTMPRSNQTKKDDCTCGIDCANCDQGKSLPKKFQSFCDANPDSVRCREFDV